MDTLQSDVAALLASSRVPFASTSSSFSYKDGTEEVDTDNAGAIGGEEEKGCLEAGRVIAEGLLWEGRFFEPEGADLLPPASTFISTPPAATAVNAPLSSVAPNIIGNGDPPASPPNVTPPRLQGTTGSVSPPRAPTAIEGAPAPAATRSSSSSSDEMGFLREMSDEEFEEGFAWGDFVDDPAVGGFNDDDYDDYSGDYSYSDDDDE